MTNGLDSLLITGGGVLFLIGGFSSLRRQRKVTGTPTSTIRSAAIGLVEVKGVAAGNPVFETPLSNIPALYFHYEEQELRTVSRGKRSRKLWVRTKEWNEGGHILIDDGTGQVRATIGPANVPDIHARKFHVQRCGRNLKDLLLARRTANAPIHEVAEKETLRWNKEAKGTVGDKRYVETYIVPGTPLYVLGTKNIEGTIGPDEKNPYIITDKKEEDIVKREEGKAKAFIALGSIFAVIGVMGLFL